MTRGAPASSPPKLERVGVTCVQFNQNDQRMVPASERLYSAIVERRLTLPDDPELARHASNASAKHYRRGRRISKGDDPDAHRRRHRARDGRRTR